MKTISITDCRKNYFHPQYFLSSLHIHLDQNFTRNNEMAESSEQVTLIHSLVTLNISDQWTRNRAQKNEDQPVFGAIIGTLAGRNVEIINTFEVRTTVNEKGCHVIDEEYFNARE